MCEEAQLLTRILCDVGPKEPAHGAYLFAQTGENENSVFAAAKELLDHGLAKTVLIPDGQARCGYPGTEAWQQGLQRAGIDGDLIEEVPIRPSDELHTLIEAVSLVRHAKAREYKRMFIVAAPFHQERAFMTAVTAALREHPQLLLYSCPGKALSWDQEVTHSQGTTEATRTGLIKGEQERIKKYQSQGDLLSRAEVLEYLTQRDSAQSAKLS